MRRAADPREAGPVVFHDRVGVRAGADDAEKKLLFRVAAVEKPVHAHALRRERNAAAF